MTQSNLFTSPDFYPTPDSLIEKMIGKVRMDRIDTILEPSAGKGNIVDFIRKRYDSEYRSSGNKSIDVIEIDPDLQLILKGKNYRLIHDDFLIFHGRKTYDLIIANFPFSNGDYHLAKAIQYLTENGGQLVCLVNAETLRKINTQQRNAINHWLRVNDAKIEYIENAFISAERKTGVEIALIHVSIERPKVVSVILDSLKKAAKEEYDTDSDPDTAIAPTDFRQSMIARFDLERKAGINLIEEYFAIRPYIMNRIPRATDSSEHGQPLIELTIRDRTDSNSITGNINSYLKGLRLKYWETLLRDPRFNAHYTSGIMKDIEAKLESLKDYDFTIFNIDELETEMRSKISRGIEQAIIKLFDEFTRKFAWNEELHNGNVHYYNGWKTNDSFKINHKIIQPMNGFSSFSYGGLHLDYHIKDTLLDMVKVFNFLAADRADVKQLVGNAISVANQTHNFRAMDLRYFETTFYKKGTCHIRFTDPDLLAKFNIFGSQRKGWLPPIYGKVAYDDLDQESKVVINDFQGREEYEKVMIRPDYFLVDTNQLMIGGETDGEINIA